MRGAVAAAMVAAGLALGACGGYTADRFACGNADGIFPGETIADWRAYADHVALVRVESGRDEATAPAADPVLTVAVRARYFNGPGAPTLPDTVDVFTRAYMLDGDEYVVPLVHFDEDETQSFWTTLSCEAPVPVRAGRIAGRNDPPPGYKPLEDRLDGQRPESVRPLLAAAEVRREVRPYMDLRPVQRARHVYGGGPP